MTFWEAIRVGLSQLVTNKMRSLLSLIGILIAVGSVTGIVSLGDGLQSYIEKEFESFGGYTRIWSWPPNQWYRNEQGRWVSRNWEEFLTKRDIEVMMAESDYISSITPYIGIGGSDASMKYRSVSVAGNVQASDDTYMESENRSLAEGRFLSVLDLARKAKVIVLGSELVEQLFGENVNPIDREIKLGSTRYTVVGVLEKKEFFDANFNTTAVIPITTAQTRITGNDRYNFITVKVTSPRYVETVAEQMRNVYSRLHAHGEEFGIQTGQQAIEEINRVLLIMKIVAGGIAGISLIVGGIGIMNIMLVSVTERTNEIGIRKALGAKRINILSQFLVEAVVLCLVGGLMGIMLGLGIGTGLAAFITNLTGMEFTSIISVKMMAVAVGFSVSVGVTFGVYPAWRASQLDPVDALRHEA